LKKYRILVVDNEEPVLKVLYTILTRAGYECETTLNGETGIRMALANPPDLIILDRVMPDMDGIEISYMLKKKHRLSQIPILMLTAMCSEEDKISALENGIDDYFCKPFSTKELLAKIKAFLRHSSRIRDSHPTTNLPGGNALEEEITRRLAAGKIFSLMHIDIDNFKSFADSYGFNSANKMIRLCGRILTSVIEPHDHMSTFLFHIGGDDFIIITSPDEHENLARAIIEKFDLHVKGCFKKEDAARGFYKGLDRIGEKRDYPLTTLSIGIISNVRMSFQDATEMGHLLVKAKNRAKQDEAKQNHKSTYIYMEEESAETEIQ
jgi:DNA-binding response OmpR family regulator